MSAASVVITIKDFAFSRPPSVRPGGQVTVLNRDDQGHTATADAGGQFDVVLNPHGSATFPAPRKPGTYPFHCIYHGNMHGVLVVK